MEKKVIGRQELHRQVWSIPISTLSKKYSLTEYELRKLCKQLQIPTPKLGYWQKVRRDGTVVVPALPANDTVAQEVDLTAFSEPRAPAPLSPLAQLQKEIEEDLKHALQVPSRLTNPDKLITAFQANIQERSQKYSLSGLINPHFGFLDVKVSTQQLTRTLILMDTLIKALKARGHKVEVNSFESNICIREEKFEIAIREKLKRSDEIKKGNYSYDYYPTGLLVLRVGRSWNGVEWQDGKLPLESRLSNIIAYLELRAKKEEKLRLINQREEEARLEKERILKEQEARKQLELVNFKKLLQQAKRWHQRHRPG